MRTKPFEVAAGLALLFLLIASARAAEIRTLNGHVPAVVANLAATGRLPAANRLELVIGLPQRNQGALSNLLQQLYDPASTNFHRYLTPEEFTLKFGPTAADYEAVLEFARTNGLKVARTNASRALVSVSAAVSDIEKAFHVNLRTYRHPTELREFFAPDVEPSVDASVPILSISGLNNFVLPHTASRRQTTTGNGGNANGTGPGGTTYRGKDFRNAYAPGVTLNGSGQYVGLVELDGYYLTDITTYEMQSGLPAVPLTNVLVDSYSGAPSTNPNNVGEVSLDIEMVIAMAPNITQLYIFQGSSFDTILGGMASNPQIKQLSSSWFVGSDATAEGFLQQFQAQGQTFFQACGDGNAYTGPIAWPGDDVNVVSVGGTSLTMNASATAYVSETVWNSGFQQPAWFGNGAGTSGTNVGGYWGSGGGVSTTYGIPGWQQGVNMAAVGGSTTKRNVPDVALTGVNVYVNYFNGLGGGFEGTSCAAPLWAGFIALVNQQGAAAGQPPVGFLNPAFYAIGAGQNYNARFHDITNGNNTWPGSTTKFFSAPGYDLCTGWGTPTGSNMINALLGYAGPVYVDFNYTGATQNGSYNAPFKTLAGGINAVGTSGTIIIRTSGSSTETPTISKRLTITTLGGAATIGN